MKDIEEFRKNLDTLHLLLIACNEYLWEPSIAKLIKLAQLDPDQAAYELIRMLGGMGSLNDVVLYKNGIPLCKENDELDQLRSKLYTLCISFSSKKVRLLFWEEQASFLKSWGY